jgi:hypothetical protein
MYRYVPGEPDFVALHHMSGGLRVDREDPAALDEAVRLVSGVVVPDVRVAIVLGDSTDEHFMDVALGMSANGSVTGYLWPNFWLSPENLARVEATAVRADRAPVAA